MENHVLHALQGDSKMRRGNHRVQVARLDFINLISVQQVLRDANVANKADSHIKAFLIVLNAWPAIIKKIRLLEVALLVHSEHFQPVVGESRNRCAWNAQVVHLGHIMLQTPVGHAPPTTSRRRKALEHARNVLSVVSLGWDHHHVLRVPPAFLTRCHRDAARKDQDYWSEPQPAHFVALERILTKKRSSAKHAWLGSTRRSSEQQVIVPHVLGVRTTPFWLRLHVKVVQLARTHQTLPQRVLIARRVRTIHHLVR
jgi:hypothetical protein